MSLKQYAQIKTVSSDNIIKNVISIDSTVPTTLWSTGWDYFIEVTAVSPNPGPGWFYDGYSAFTAPDDPIPGNIDETSLVLNSGGTPSLNWGNRQLVDVNGKTAFDWTKQGDINVPGMITNYNGDETFGRGLVPVVYATEGDGALADSSFVYSVPGSSKGFYDITLYAVITTDSFVGATSAEINVRWADDSGSQKKKIGSLPTTLGKLKLGTMDSQRLSVLVSGGTDILVEFVNAAWQSAQYSYAVSIKRTL